MGRIRWSRWQVASTTCTTSFVALLALGVLSSDVCEEDCFAEWRLVGTAAVLWALNLLAVLCVRRHELRQEEAEEEPVAVPHYSEDERSSMM